MLQTTKSQMRSLKKGEIFNVNGEEHVASTNSHRSGDASYEGYIVYDENNDSWFEEDFPESVMGKQKMRETLLIFDHIYGLLYNGKIPENRDMLEKGVKWIIEHNEEFKALEAARQDLFMSDREINALALALDL